MKFLSYKSFFTLYITSLWLVKGLIEAASMHFGRGQSALAGLLELHRFSEMIRNAAQEFGRWPNQLVGVLEGATPTGMAQCVPPQGRGRSVADLSRICFGVFLRKNPEAKAVTNQTSLINNSNRK
jgi:hypothetical protein